MMIKRSRYIIAAVLCLGFSTEAEAQSNFSPAAYMEFMEQHQDYSVQQLLNDHPAKTDYYSQRQYPADLSAISWYDSLNSHYSFTGDEKRYLEQHHFMVSERLVSYDWASAFIGLYSNDLPLFLSTDFILSTLHNSYDAILQTIEWQFLEPNLIALLQAMYNRLPLVADRYAADSRFEDVLKDVDLYIAVALSLAEGEACLPQYDTPDKYNQLMAAVEAEEMTEMPLFTKESRLRKLDFSQFTPRGHYNKEIYTGDGVITLEHYFRAMMWLGRIDFLLTAPPENPWESGWTDDELRRMQLGALLTNEVLYSCGKLDNLTKHEKIISFMVGPDDNMTPAELKQLADRDLTSPADLFGSAVFDSFMDSLNASDDYGQKIMSNFFYVDPQSEDPGSLPVSYKLLGQKFLVDSYVFSQLVFDRIVLNGEKIWRPLPDPLDAMAVLGNEDALALLEAEMEEYKYASNMAGLQYLIESYDDTFWEQSLYNTWLGALRSLNPPSTSYGLPYFMQTTAWHHEKLNTQLASWAQLRHDNILYGKQSYTGGTGCSYPYTYVEPYPGFYRNLKVFAENAVAFFNDVLSGEMVELKDQITGYYTRFASLMNRLESIAAKELERTELSNADITFLKTMINGYMSSGPSITGWYNDLFFDLQKGLTGNFTVADVHTQPTELNGAVVGNVLHVGNGLINTGVFIAENPCRPGQYMAFAGPVSSFHSRVTSNFRRLNDQEWEEYFKAGYENLPSRPDWVAPYLLDHEGNAYPKGRELKGTLYTGIQSSPGHDPQPLDYLLLFPNPVSEETHIRFVLNVQREYSLKVYDASGRIIYLDPPRLLLPAEHDMVLPGQGWQPGIYLVRIRIGSREVTRELMIR